MRVLLGAGITRAAVERGEAGLEDAWLLTRSVEQLAEDCEAAEEAGRLAEFEGEHRWLTHPADWF